MRSFFVFDKTGSLFLRGYDCLRLTIKKIGARVNG